MTGKTLNITLIPLLAALFPLVGANVAYIIAAVLEHVPSCIPYLEGCTTVSSTGRAAPESLWFRATMIPGAVLMIFYWRLNGGWLLCLEQDHYKGSTIIQVLGIFAGLFLVMYTVALGFIGEEYALMRRTGVTLFFGLNYLAQVLLTRRLWYFSKRNPGVFPSRLITLKLGLCWFLLVVGLISIPISNFIGTDAPENIVEWNFSVLMYCYFFLTYWGWRVTGFHAGLFVNTISKII